MIGVDYSFTTMKYFGIWRPMNWTSKWSIRLYNVYNYFMMAFVYSFGLTFLISICQNFDDLDLLTENVFFFSGLSVLSFKITYIFIYRENIIAFKNMFLQTKCNPRDIYEMAIREKFHENSRSNLRWFMILCILTVAVHTGGPLMKGKNVTLPFRNWMPYNIESGFAFWITYIYQTLGIFTSVIMFVAVETLASAVMQQICAQLEIIMYRLLELPKLSKTKDSRIVIYHQESKLIKEYVLHHDYMYTIEEKLNDIFGLMVFVQFFATTLNLCTVVYQLSRKSVYDVKFWSLSGILLSFIIQIFLYCWYGDEMIKKSLAITDTIFQMNWTLLSKETRKSLIIIMIRSSRPVKLSGASMITMSVDTFVKILKASYSAFSLLRRS